MVELIKDASNSIFTKNPIRRVFSNPVTYNKGFQAFGAHHCTIVPSKSTYFSLAAISEATHINAARIRCARMISYINISLPKDPRIL